MLLEGLGGGWVQGVGFLVKGGRFLLRFFFSLACLVAFFLCLVCNMMHHFASPFNIFSLFTYQKKKKSWKRNGYLNFLQGLTRNLMKWEVESLAKSLFPRSKMCSLKLGERQVGDIFSFLVGKIRIYSKSARKRRINVHTKYIRTNFSCFQLLFVECSK